MNDLLHTLSFLATTVAVYAVVVIVLAALLEWLNGE